MQKFPSSKKPYRRLEEVAQDVQLPSEQPDVVIDGLEKVDQESSQRFTGNKSLGRSESHLSRYLSSKTQFSAQGHDEPSAKGVRRWFSFKSKGRRSQHARQPSSSSSSDSSGDGRGDSGTDGEENEYLFDEEVEEVLHELSSGDKGQAGAKRRGGIKHHGHKRFSPFRRSKLKYGQMTVLSVNSVWLLLTVALFCAAIALLVFGPNKTAWYLEVWRVLLFLSLVLPLKVVADLAVKLLVVAVERRMPLHQVVIFFLVGTKHALAQLLWAGSVVAAFAVLGVGMDDHHNVQNAYDAVLRLLCCVLLLLLANLLVHVIEKVVALKFHEEAYFNRMHDALRKEFYLMQMCELRGNLVGTGAHYSWARRGVLGAAAAQGNSSDEHNGGGSADKQQQQPGSSLDAADSRLGHGLDSDTLVPNQHLPTIYSASELQTRGGVAASIKEEEMAQWSPVPSPPLPPAAPVPAQGLGRQGGSPPPPTIGEAAAPSPPGIGSVATAPIPILKQALPRSPRDNARGDGDRRQGQQQQQQQPAPRQSPGSGGAVLGRSPGADSNPPSFSSVMSRGGIGGTSRRSFMSAASRRSTSASEGGPGDRRARKQMSDIMRLAEAFDQAAAQQDHPDDKRHSGGGTRSGSMDSLQMVKAMHLLERHIRSKQMYTFTDQIVQVDGYEDDNDSAVHVGQGPSSSSLGSTGNPQVRRVALYLFMNVRSDQERQYVTLEDLGAFLDPDDAAAAFEMLDVNRNGKVSLGELREAVAGVYRERTNLAAALKGSKTVVAQLGRVIAAVIHAAFLLFYLVILGANTQNFWISTSSAILGFSFIFASYAASIFANTMFLFGVHPFEVGDVVLINGTNHVVREIMLQHTRMEAIDGAMVWFPNARLQADPFCNLTKSSPKWETIRVLVDITAPVQQLVEEGLKQLPARLEEHEQDFTGKFNVAITGIRDPLKAEVMFTFELQQTGIDLRKLASSRTKFYGFVIDLIRDLRVSYTLPDFGSSVVGNSTSSREDSSGAALKQQGGSDNKHGGGLAQRAGRAAKRAVQAVQSAPPTEYGKTVMKQDM